MFRWSSLFTRFAILFLIAAAIWIGRDPLLQIAITNTLESTVGAKVEIGQVRTSFSENKLFIKNFTVADPRNSMRNLFQADSAIIELDRDSLLKRRIKIVDGLSSQMVFGSPRLSSGTINHISPPSTKSPEVTVASDNQLNQNWLEEFEYIPTTPQTGELELTKTAKKIFSQLNTTIEKQDSKLGNLKSVVREIHDLVNFDDNPLRNAQRLKNAQTKVSSLKFEIDTIGAALAQLDRQIAAHKNELVNAKNNDVELLEQWSIRKQIDGHTLTKLLLNQDLADQAEEIVNWYLAFRESLPEPNRDFHLGPRYGRNVPIPGLSNVPTFLIERMQLDGEGRLAGNKFSFSGEVKNVSLDPFAHQHPVMFDLRAQGNTHFAVKAILDRTSGNMRDQLSVKCPNLVLPSRQLDAKMMLVHVSPCRSKIDVQLNCSDDQLDGRIEFDYDNLVMQIESLADQAGGQPIADRVNLDLASISGYQVSATVKGNLLNPSIHFESDLGEKFATKLNTAIASVAKSPKSDLDAQLQNHLTLLESKYGERIRLLAFKLENELLGQQRAAVAELQKKLKYSSSSDLNLR